MALAKQKVVVITGGGAGIGRACALHFAGEGFSVLVCDQSAEAVDQTCNLIKASRGTALGHVGDISMADSSTNIVELAMQRWGRIDALVANAGVQTGGSLLETEESDWDRILGVNLKGVAYSCKAVLPVMLRQASGAIVMISSVNALVGSAGMAIYDASKAGVLALMRNLAVEYGRKGVRVNAICPGNTITDFHINRMAEKGITADQIREMSSDYGLLGRAGEPAEIASAAFFLASEQASFVTGHTLVVDGGYSAGSQA